MEAHSHSGDTSQEDETEDAPTTHLGSDTEEQSSRPYRTVLEEQQENRIVDWYRDHPMYYDKTHRDYKNRTKRDNIMTDFGKTIGVTSKLFFFFS